jgi:hypothetical protein
MAHWIDVKIHSGETLSGLVMDYGHHVGKWSEVWNAAENESLRSKRGTPNRIVTGDHVKIPIPWKITYKTLSPLPSDPNLYKIIAKRDGEQGKRLWWVQTVFGDNQPKFGPYPYSVDLPTDDDLPYYWTEAEVGTDATRRKYFEDVPNRGAPKDRTTNWRAVLSIGVVADKTVTVYNSIVWGVDFGKDGVNSPYRPRPATSFEVKGHVNVLRNGRGKTQTFKAGGWTFKSF